MLVIFSLTLFGCNNQPQTTDNEVMECKWGPPTVVLQPCNTFTEKEAQDLVPKLQKFIEG